MKKILPIYEQVKHKINDDNIDLLLSWLDKNRLLAGETPSIHDSYFTIQIYLFRTAIFRLSYNFSSKIIFLDKPIKVEANTVRYSVFEKDLGDWNQLLINKNKKYFDSDQVHLFIEKLEKLLNMFNSLIHILTSTIKLKEVTLINYRGFTNQKICFNEQINVIIGENGSGKTSILDSVATSIGSFLSGFDELTSSESKPLKKNDFHWDGSNYQIPCEVNSILAFQKKNYSVSRSISAPQRTMTKLGGIEIAVFAKTVVDEIRHDNNRVILPVFAYYGVSAFQQKGMKIVSHLSKKRTRFNAYFGCLINDFYSDKFENWFRTSKFEQFNQTLDKEQLLLLELVEGTISKSLKYMDEKYQNVKIAIKNDEIVIYNNDKYMPLKLLSDGYRKTINIVADIVWKMITLNPQLGKNAAKETPGIILSDEIDFLLHPKWQRKILILLKELFPKVQFIVTTHSPNIISTVHKENIIIIEDNSIVEETPFTYGRDINSILLELMNTPERSNDVQEKISRFYSLLEQEKYDEAEKIINELIEFMGPNDATIVRANTMLKLERL